MSKENKPREKVVVGRKVNNAEIYTYLSIEKLELHTPLSDYNEALIKEMQAAPADYIEALVKAMGSPLTIFTEATLRARLITAASTVFTEAALRERLVGASAKVLSNIKDVSREVI